MRLESFMRKHPYLFIFIVAFLMMAIVVTPDIIMNKGYFIFSGDYNVQELPFYQQLHRVIKSGNLTYDWNVGLGQDVITFYSYYCLTKIFFWITIPFPNSFVPFLMPIIMCLKFAFAALFSCMYIRRFVKSKNAYFIGALLYSFAGFMVNSLYYPDFNDVFVFFPLLLIALEEAVTKDRKGFFALMIAFSAITHYYFFFGQVIFIIIYFLVRANIWNRIINLLYKLNKKGEASFIKLTFSQKDIDNDFPVTFKSFFRLIIEGAIGVLCSAVILLPNFLLILNNPRVSEKLYGTDLIVPQLPVLLFEIVRSLFMLPDMPAISIFFEKYSMLWFSDAVALPVLGIVAVTAFFKIYKRHWAKTLTVVCAIMVCVPGLNAIFQLMNLKPYYRWMYMPILILAMMSAKAIESLREENRLNEKTEDHFGVFQEPARDGWKLGFKITFIALGILGIIAYLPKKDIVKDSLLNSGTARVVWGEFPQDKSYFWTGFLIVLVLYIVTMIITLKKNKTGRALLSAVIIGSIITTSCSFYLSYINSQYFYKDLASKTYNANLDFPSEDGEFFRLDNVNISSERNPIVVIPNAPIYWGMPSISLFSTTMSGQNIKFYQYYNEGKKSWVEMKLNPMYYGIRGLFSVKYYYENKEDKLKISDFSNITRLNPGYELLYETEQWGVYENKYYIPMGFAFDYYLTEEQVDKYKEDNIEDKEFKRGQEEKLLTVEEKTEAYTALSNTLVSALILTEEQAEKYKDIIFPYDGEIIDDKEQYALACAERKSMSCSSFVPNNKGFEAKISLDKSKLVFFSIPYSEGFVAIVNGKPAEIELVDKGLMAVKVPAGDSTIKFFYKTPGLETGIILSSVGLIGLLICFIPTLKKLTKKKIKSNESTGV